MEARKQLDGLTFKEMRFKVCRFLEEQGAVNDLRARLRYKFVEALTITTQSAKRSSRTLLHQVVMWLIQDYLSSQGYEYALCTLACESGVNQEPFSARDVKRLLHLPHLDGQPVLEGIVARMLSQPETALVQTSVAASADARGGQDDTLCAAAEVHAEFKKLQQLVAEAEQRLLAVQQQLQSAQSEQAVAHLQAVRHMSVLTELSSVGSNCILEGSTPPTLSSRHTQSQTTRNSSVSSVFSLLLDRARRRLRHLSLQTDYLDDKLRAMRDDPLLPSVSTHDVSSASCEKSSEAHSFNVE